MFLTEVFNKILIPVALLAAQMKIAMSSLDTIAQMAQDAQQRHAVGTPAECDYMKTILRQELMLRDEIFNLIRHSTYNTSPLRYSPSGW